MKTVILEGKDFNRLIQATKAFISGTDRRPIYHYIKLDVDAESKRVTAAACDGYRLSVERAKAYEANENFSVYIFPISKQPAKSFVTIELHEKDVLIRCGERIFGCRQPKCAEGFLDYEKFFSEETTFRVGFNHKLLKDALAAAEASVGNVMAPLIFEFKSPSTPCFIKTGGKRENLKMVLPVRISDGVNCASAEGDA